MCCHYPLTDFHRKIKIYIITYMAILGFNSFLVNFQNPLANGRIGEGQNLAKAQANFAIRRLQKYNHSSIVLNLFSPKYSHADPTLRA